MLLKNAIHFATKHTGIYKNDFEVMCHARKSMLLHSTQPCVKGDSGIFDFTMIT